MLQWMGGSRRKVAASHTSVKKRQKQYFEQRRQQQHQLTVGSESCTNDINNSNQHSREHQSLDILNLLNLSTATPECKLSCPENGMQDLDADFYSLKDNISGVGSSFNHIAEPTSSKRTLFSLPDNQTNDFKKANTDNQTNDFKKANTTADLMDGTERKLSVFDLVGDDHTTTNLEECSPSEAHMAFSVEGLGKINTETPVNSPQPSDRTFVYRCSSPWMVNGQPNTSHVRERLNDFENEVDTIIESSKIFQDDSRYRSPIGIHAKDGGRKQKLQTFSDHLHKQYSDSRSNFCDVADFNNSRFSDDEWNAKSAFLDDGEDSFYWKGEQPCQKESLNPDFLKYGKDYTESRSSSEHHRKKKRDYLETTWRSNIRDSPTRRSHLLERNIDHPSFAKPAYFRTSDFDFNNVFDQPVWSSIVPEEDKDSHSLRSEESCSSSAVWTNETHNSQFETNTRQRKRETNSFRNLGDKYYLNNNLFQESWEDWDVDDQHMKRQVGSGKQVRLSNPGKLKSTSQREGGLDESYNWFAEGFSSAGINSDITSERDKPYPFLNAEIGSSHWRSSRAPDSIPETWVPKFSVGGTGDDDDEDDYVNCLSANHKSKLAGGTCGFENDTLSENDNEQSREVNHPKIQGDETSSSVAKSLSDENEYNPNKEVMQARHQVNRESGEKTSRDSLQQMIMLERRTLQLVCFNKTLLLDSLKT
ncbi:uncharacterized protein LOC9317180 isoform X1 [Arabidopsis lyrata subsp. lyrata]|uniref:uncharacterized protein LOC9317180 isoform X1 n=1 Tax=Arabidopsis lyrata subsp. lyrata TaxID=81972 RepID=UPI000A29AA1B|nr:uncharacterized protein LOC9317180 isoform X1 [Arabidopsis lyrata subsp. lyrata]|eukprot:XP_020883048.1 uncharacterized protein LOC9317180 isoform X1 [Arabidopsis lyrata subsp. lyrata]